MPYTLANPLPAGSSHVSLCKMVLGTQDLCSNPLHSSYETKKGMAHIEEDGIVKTSSRTLCEGNLWIQITKAQMLAAHLLAVPPWTS